MKKNFSSILYIPCPLLDLYDYRIRKTIVYDPSKSETFKALQEAELGNHVQEITIPVTRVFSPVKTPTKVCVKIKRASYGSGANYDCCVSDP